jgi:hypothetical protein
MHVHAAHAHIVLGHIMHAHDVNTHTVHAHTVHSKFYLRINGDMPAGAMVLKPVFRGFLSPCRHNYKIRVGISLKNLPAYQLPLLI